MNAERKRKNIKALIISFFISAALLGLVIGMSLWYQSYRNVTFEPVAMLVCDAAGFLTVFSIVYHFLKTPTDQ